VVRAKSEGEGVEGVSIHHFAEVDRKHCPTFGGGEGKNFTPLHHLSQVRWVEIGPLSTLDIRM